MKRIVKLFTLIELLVVIAIIAILAAMLLPSLARAKDKGRQAACMGNLKQLGLGANMYVQSFNEIFPVIGWAAPRDDYYYMFLPLKSYLGSHDILKCPDGLEMGTPMQQINYAANSGGINWSVWGNRNWAGTFYTTPKQLAHIKNPTRVVEIGDARAAYPHQGIYDFAGANFFEPLHINSMNFSFIDGHVLSMDTIATASYDYTVHTYQNRSFEYDY